MGAGVPARTSCELSALSADRDCLRWSSGMALTHLPPFILVLHRWKTCTASEEVYYRPPGPPRQHHVTRWYLSHRMEELLKNYEENGVNTR